MQKTKKLVSVLLAAVMIFTTLLIAPVTALAVDDPGTLDASLIEFWADPENKITADKIAAFQGGDKTTMTGAVAVHKRSGSSSNYYLFLPSNADCTALKVWFTADEATLDGVPLENGGTTDAFSSINNGGTSRDHTLTLGATSYTLHVMKSGNVGTVYIDTASGSIASINNSADKSVSESGSIMVVEPNGKVDYDGALKKMKGRGNATWSAKGKKNPYNINLDKKAGLLGMDKSKKWCLLANADDATLIKNQLTYDFAEYIGIPCQVVCKPVDLYVNQQYLGSYQLAEKVEIGSARVEVSDAYEALEEANKRIDPDTGKEVTDLDGTAIQEFSDENGAAAGSDSYSANKNAQTIGMRKYSPSLTSPEDVTGGYLYELEISNRWEDEGAGFCAYNRQGWVVKSCDYASQDMVNYSYDLFFALGSSVYNGGVVPSVETTTNCSSLGSTLLYGDKSVTNPAPKTKYQGKKWDELLDKNSAVKYYWTQEYFKNMDSSTSSTYFFKDSDNVDSLLYAGPMWDMDQSLWYSKSASRWGSSYTSSDGWYTKNTRIYRWRANDASTSYSNDNQAPLTFYAALANNCSDFWRAAESEWYTTIAPAAKILTGEATDSSGVLKSVADYANTIALSGSMNNLRHNLNSDAAYDAASVTNGITTWLSDRASWITTQIAPVNIANDNDITVDRIPAQNYTGSAVEPKVTVRYGGVALQEGVDYTVTYSNNIDLTSLAEVKVTGKGRYNGDDYAYFVIRRGSLTNGSLELPDTVGRGTVLTAAAKNEDGNEMVASVNYQWYADGVAIEGETAKTYTTTLADVGKTITVKATGDGVNCDTSSITSNGCVVTYDAQAQYSVTFINAAGETVSETEYTDGTAAADVVVPANTASYHDAEKHYTYAWDEVADVTASVTYYEHETGVAHTFTPSVVIAPDCTNGGTTNYACTCGYNYDEPTDALGHTPAAPVKENITDSSYDEVIYCSVCKTELDRNTVVTALPEGSVPKNAEAVAEDASIVKVNTSSITTAVSLKKKSIIVNFKQVNGATNYRIRYRAAGAKDWIYDWTAGKPSYELKNLKKNGLYEFQIAVYVYKNRGWQRSAFSNMNYRYFNKVSSVKAKARGSRKVKVSWKADKNATGYDVAYSLGANGKKTVKTVKGAKKKTLTLKKLKKGKKYVIYVRTYKVKNGKKYTGQWSKKTVKIK